MAERAPSPVPEGMNTITTQLFYGGNCSDAIGFYERAFGASVVGEIARGPDGKSIMHAMIQIGNSHVMLADAWPGYEGAPDGGSTASCWLYVEDCDALWNQAVAAGGEVMFPIMDAFWGDRVGKLKDPFGHCWAIASHKWNYTHAEIVAGQKAWLESMKG